jgi:hypothetical protein
MSDIMQLGGAVLITVGAGLIYVPAGLVVGGIFAILIGLSLERR